MEIENDLRQYMLQHDPERFVLYGFPNKLGVMINLAGWLDTIPQFIAQPYAATPEWGAISVVNLPELEGLAMEGTWEEMIALARVISVIGALDMIPVPDEPVFSSMSDRGMMIAEFEHIEIIEEAEEVQDGDPV